MNVRPLRKNRVFYTLLMLLLSGTMAQVSVAQSALPLETYGIWDRDGAGFDPGNPNYDYLRGIGYTSSWARIQPDDSSSYNWEDIQKTIDWAAKKKLTMFLGIGAGPDSPEWIYENGVPRVYTTVTREAHKRWPYYPYYLDPDYKRHYFRFIRELGDFLQSQAPEKLKYIGFIQVKSGCTGDECAYKGTITDAAYEQYRLDKTGDRWLGFRLQVFDLHNEVFVRREHPIALLFNCADEIDWHREWKWVSENIVEGFGVKGLAYVRGHHLTGEQSFVKHWKPYTIDPEGLALFSRAEMDNTWKWPLFRINLELGFYWGAISGLNQGLSVWDIFKGALTEAGTNPSIQNTFRFFNEYADQVYPESSTKAFIALHEGLDASDTIKFPESKYGEASKNNLKRYQAICDDPVYAGRGARMDDLPSAPRPQHKQRQEQTGYNDAGWDIWSGNYSRFITQVDPGKESVGLFRIGGPIDADSPVYSRFARSFEYKSGRNAMYFKLHDDFFREPAGTLSIAVTYYDKTKGSRWELWYDAGEGNFKRAARIKGKGSKIWKTETIYLTDAVMLHHGPEGSDFALVNTDKKDDIFHMIEIEKEETGPYLATGIKIGEVTSSSAIIWTRLSRNPEAVDSSAAMPEVLYRNPQTGELTELPKGKPDWEPEVIYPAGSSIDNIEGAVPGTEGEVRIQYRAEGEKEWQLTQWMAVDPGHDYTRQFRLSGLVPGTKYILQVESRSPGGKGAECIKGGFRTAPPAGKESKVVFTVTTGTAYPDRDMGGQGFKIYPLMQKLDPDFFVHTGDILYYDLLAKDLELANYHWARMYSLPTNIEFHRQVASYFIKDDHDTWMNDCWPGKKTKFMGDFTFEQGQQVFLEQVPMEGSKTYRTFRWGKDLQIWMVEGRDYRSPNTMADGPEKTIWGEEQMEWFKRTVQESDASFRILISPTPIVGPDRSNKMDNHANLSFKREGDEIRSFIASQKDMLVVCGDRHWQYASVDAETGIREYSCGPASDAHAGGWSNDKLLPEHIYLNVIGGFLSVTVDRAEGKPVITFTFHGVDGQVLFEDELIAGELNKQAQ